MTSSPASAGSAPPTPPAPRAQPSALGLLAGAVTALGHADLLAELECVLVLRGAQRHAAACTSSEVLAWPPLSELDPTWGEPVALTVAIEDSHPLARCCRALSLLCQNLTLADSPAHPPRVLTLSERELLATLPERVELLAPVETSTSDLLARCTRTHRLLVETHVLLAELADTPSPLTPLAHTWLAHAEGARALLRHRLDRSGAAALLRARLGAAAGADDSLWLVVSPRPWLGSDPDASAVLALHSLRADASGWVALTDSVLAGLLTSAEPASVRTPCALAAEPALLAATLWHDSPGLSLAEATELARAALTP